MTDMCTNHFLNYAACHKESIPVKLMLPTLDGAVRSPVGLSVFMLSLLLLICCEFDVGGCRRKLALKAKYGATISYRL